MRLLEKSSRVERRFYTGDQLASRSLRDRMKPLQAIRSREPVLLYVLRKHPQCAVLRRKWYLDRRVRRRTHPRHALKARLSPATCEFGSRLLVSCHNATKEARVP